MISAIQSGENNKVVIYSLDRLIRSVIDWLFLFDIFSYHNVKLTSMRENIDTTTAQGRFFVMIIILVTKWERGEGSEKTKSRMRQAIRDGK